MIQVKHLSLLRNGRHVLEDISLVVEPGQCLALLGPSGAGKTSLLRVIAGLERPDTGEVRLNGVIVSSSKAVHPPEARNLSMIFQSLALWPHMTVAQHIKFVSRGEANHGHALVSRMGLDGKEGSYPDQLSGGEQQRLAIARALASNPRYLLMDEPFSNLDEILRDSLLSMALEQIHSNLIASIFVTHNVDEAIKTADLLAIMTNGRLYCLWQGKKLRSITRNEILECFKEAGYGK